MSYPSGGFPAQGGPQHQPQQGQQTQHFAPVQPAPAPGPAKPLPIGLIGALIVTVLGLVSYFLTFADALTFGGPTLYLVVGGLLAALSLIPDGPKTLPFAALFSVLGFLATLSALIESPSVAGVLIVQLILSILQVLASVAVLLFDLGIVKMPAPRPAQPAYGGPGQFGHGQFGPPQSGGFGQPGQPGQQGQPGQFGGAPAQSPAQGPTTYAAQQGQFHQQPPSFGQQPGQPGQQPGQQAAEQSGQQPGQQGQDNQ